jgi:hypothetical protein
MQPGGHLRRAGCILDSRRRSRSAGAQIGAEERGLIRDLLTCRERGFIENVYYVSALSGVRVRRESSIYTTYNIRLRSAGSKCSSRCYFSSTHCSCSLALILYYIRGSRGEEIRGPAAGSVCLYLIFERLLLAAGKEKREMLRARIPRFVFLPILRGHDKRKTADQSCEDFVLYGLCWQQAFLPRQLW